MSVHIYEVNTVDLFDTTTVNGYVSVLTEALKINSNVIVLGSKSNQLKFKTLILDLFKPAERRVVSFKPLPTLLEPISGVQGKPVLVLDDKLAVMHDPVLSSLTLSGAAWLLVAHTGPVFAKQ